MSIRDEVRYKKAVLQREVSVYERRSQDLGKGVKMMQEELEGARQSKKATAKMPAPADPTQASNDRLSETGITTFLALYAQALTAYDVVIEIVKDTKEALKILESVSAEEVTEEKLRQALADVSKFDKTVSSKKSAGVELFQVFFDTIKAFRALMDKFPQE